MDSVADEKFSLRQQLLQRRREASDEQRAQWNAALSQHVLLWCRSNNIQTLGVYCAIRGEPDLAAAFTALDEDGVVLALPIVQERDAPLLFARWQPGDALVKDEMGVPVPALQVLIAMPQALLIPCVGFNDAHYRLGYGGGYYDRTLARAPRPLAVGVAYSSSRAEFAAEAHDIALDAIITESGASPS
ncbi:MAG TPA: 5-formyltetrahydrofolate cyclo-ligase [Burkholderiaceae bacterium]